VAEGWPEEFSSKAILRNLAPPWRPCFGRAPRSVPDESTATTGVGGWRFFLVAHVPSLTSPYSYQPWPPGWVRGACTDCARPPGRDCSCGLIVLRERAELVWWLLVMEAGVWCESRNAGRLALARVETRGRELTCSTPEAPVFEYRVEEARVAELFVPVDGGHRAGALSARYGVPVQVGAASGRTWLDELEPVIPSAPELLTAYGRQLSPQRRAKAEEAMATARQDRGPNKRVSTAPALAADR
jgi:hypothetical protein